MNIILYFSPWCTMDGFNFCFCNMPWVLCCKEQPQYLSTQCLENEIFQSMVSTASLVQHRALNSYRSLP